MYVVHIYIIQLSLVVKTAGRENPEVVNSNPTWGKS